MSKLPYWVAVLVLAMAVGAVTFASIARTAGAFRQQEPPQQATLDEHTIEEIETDRLVCAVAWSTLGHNVAISCVPNIPGLFEEPGQ